MTPESLSKPYREEIERFVTEWTDEDTAGIGLAVATGDGIVYADGFGTRSLSGDEPATEATLFGFGSCTKSVTAVAIAQLAERGELAVTDPVNDYVSHLAGAPGDPITIRELLTHTSGMPGDWSVKPLMAGDDHEAHFDVIISDDEDFRRHVEGSLDQRVTDRDTFFYYNSGYTILGKVVEAVSGDEYSDYVRTNVLEPLGMDRSTFSEEDFRAANDRMPVEFDYEGHSIRSVFPFEPLLHPPGGLLSSPTEMANYTRMFVGDGSVDGTSVLSSRRLEEMTTPVSTFGTRIDGRDIGYGYGLQIEDFLGDTLIGHGGSITISNAWFGYLDDAGVGVAIARSTAPSTTFDVEPSSLGPGVLSILQDEAPTESVLHFRLLDALERVTGEYTSYRDIGSATVEREGGMLALSRGGFHGRDGRCLKPERVTGDLLVCSTTRESGLEHEVRFELGGENVEFFYERSRFTEA